MAMIAALCAVIKKDSIFCIHVNHNLRIFEETKGDAGLVLDFCKKQGINCKIINIPHGKIESLAKKKSMGVEAAARFFRRRAFFREAALLGDKTLILTAHTNDDALELSLMRIIRGAGPVGLAAMPQTRSRFIRPLLSMTRSDVTCYLAAKNIPWREDSTNTDEKFLRNRVRLRLIPLLNKSFPSWRTGISVMAETQSLVKSFIIHEAESRVIWDIVPEKPQIKQGINASFNACAFAGESLKEALSADADNFFSQMQIVREESLYLAIDKLLKGVKNPRSVKRSAVRRFCAGAKAADLGPVRIRQEGGRIFVFRAEKEFFECGFSLLIK